MQNRVQHWEGHSHKSGAADVASEQRVELLLHNPAEGSQHGHAAVGELRLAEALALTESEGGRVSEACNDKTDKVLSKYGVMFI